MAARGRCFPLLRIPSSGGDTRALERRWGKWRCFCCSILVKCFFYWFWCLCCECHGVTHTAVTGVLCPRECGTHTSVAVSCWWQMDGDCVCVCQEIPCPRRCPSTKPVCVCVCIHGSPCLSMPNFCGEGSPSTLLGQSVSVRHPGLHTHHANTHTHTPSQTGHNAAKLYPMPCQNQYPISLSHTHLQSKDIGLTPISTTVCQCVEPTT